MKLQRTHWVGIIAGGLILLAGLIIVLIFKDFNLFLFLFGIAVGAMALPFIIGLVMENKREQEVSSMFLEFSRNLAESVNTGTPISKSIINMSKKNYGALSPYIQKLANQIAMGIPVNQAMQVFSREVDNSVISRAIALISQAERAGGEIDQILESVAQSIAEVEKLKNERKAAISNLVVQGYIIFFIFVGIMLIMEFKILPMTTGMSEAMGSGGGGETLAGVSGGLGGFGGGGGGGLDPASLAKPFLYLLLVQGSFAGLTIGKLAEGSVKAGIKHSFIMTIFAFLISTGARAFLG